MTKKGIRGSIRIALSGGPLDGAQYGDLPDPGRPAKFACVSIPLSQPADTALRALYVCHAPGTPDDVWRFTFHKTVFPKLPVGTEANFL